MAVFTHLSKAEIDQVCLKYGIQDVLCFDGVKSGVENTTYVVSTSNSKYVLTVIERRVDTQDIQYFHETREHFLAYGIPAPISFDTSEGKTFQEILGKPAVLSVFLPGISRVTISDEDCFKMGQMLGKMHSSQSGISSKKSNTVSISSLKNILSLCSGVISKQVLEHLQQELQFQSNINCQNWLYGTIHADLFPDNVFFDENNNISGIIDWYFACYDLLLYDLAITMIGWCYGDSNEWIKSRAFSMLRGYVSVYYENNFTDADLRLMLRRACVRIAVTRLYDFTHPRQDGLVTPKDPNIFIDHLSRHQTEDLITGWR